jgi:hypothetical protein
VTLLGTDDPFSSGHLDRITRLVNGDAELGVIGRFLTIDFGIVSGTERYLFEFREGRLLSAARSPDLVSCAVVFEGGRSDWDNFCVETPRPGYNDVIGMDRDLDTFSIPVGRVVFMRHLRSLARVMRLVQLARGCEDTESDNA